VGVAGGVDAGDIFVRGEIVERAVPAKKLADRLERLVRKVAAERG